MKISRIFGRKKEQMLSTLIIVLITIASCSKQELSLNPGIETLSSSTASNSSANLMYNESFEGSNPFSTYVGKQSSTTYGITVSSDHAYTGTKSARFELRDTDPIASNGTRAEIKFPPLTNPNRWYSYNIYFPSAQYQYDSDPEILNQWHQGGGISPSIAVETRYDRMLIDVRPDPGTKFKYDLGAMVKDKWSTLVLHIIHSHGADGLIEIWKDGVKILTRTGANSYAYPPYDHPKWKLGLYKWGWNGTGTTDTKLRVVYFDNIRLGDENATYADMTSGSTAPPPPPPPPPTDTTPPPPPPPPPSGTAIKDFTLINSSTEKDIKVITEGEVISLKQLGVSKLNIRANLQSSDQSVKFELTGPQVFNYTDNALPFALFGDNGAGNYYYGIWNPPAIGNYTLKATPYSGTKLTGTAGKPVSLHFSFTN
jgi:hypothetical protein